MATSSPSQENKLRGAIESDNCSRFRAKRATQSEAERSGAKRSEAERSGAERSEVEIATSRLNLIGFRAARRQHF